MKRFKQILGLGVLVAVSFGMSGCFFGEINNAAKEIAEVREGKVFQIPTATLEYNDGTIFAFAENGKKQRIENGNSVMIYDASNYWVLDSESKTAIKYSYDAEYLYNTTYCFLEATWKLANYDESVTKTSETIAGKSCTVYTDKDDDSKQGGWKRILFVSNDVKATSFTISVSSSAFTVPVDYTITDQSDSMQ